MADLSFFEGMLGESEQQRQQKQALQAMLVQVMLKQRIQQSDPMYQFNQIKMAQALDAMRRQAQFQRMGDIGFGGARPTAQEALPYVPQNLQQRFMQRPTSPPGFVGQQIRKPFERVGQALVPGQQGWQRTRLPSGTARTTVKSKQVEEEIKSIFAEFGEEGLSPEQRDYYNRL